MEIEYMNTIYELGSAIEQIRSAANTIEVSGARNIEAVYTIFKLCNNIIEVLNEIVEKNSINPENQDGDIDGEIDS